MPFKTALFFPSFSVFAVMKKQKNLGGGILQAVCGLKAKSERKRIFFKNVTVLLCTWSRCVRSERKMCCILVCLKGALLIYYPLVSSFLPSFLLYSFFSLHPPSLFHQGPQVKGSSSCLRPFRILTVWSLTFMLQRHAVHFYSIYHSDMSEGRPEQGRSMREHARNSAAGLHLCTTRRG